MAERPREQSDFIRRNNRRKRPNQQNEHESELMATATKTHASLAKMFQMKWNVTNFIV